MKKAIFILAIFILALIGCRGKKQLTDELITVDVAKTNYSPKKELILQDFIDVEYIALETNFDFLNQGWVQDIGKKIILVKNVVRDGNIFVYDRQGKAIRKINRKGQGPEEYTHITNLTLDEYNGEMFVNDHFLQKIIVYDLFGNFKRNINHKESVEKMFYTNMFNYDNDNLIIYGRFYKEIAYFLVSKQDGSITNEIRIPFKEKKLLMKQLTDEQSGGISTVAPDAYTPMINFNGNWILTDYSSDTIFAYKPDYGLRPFIVRTPSIQSMNPEVMLVLRFLSDRYYFMETVKNEYNFSTRSGFPITSFIMYDTKEKAFFGYNVYNGDYTTKKEIYMNFFTPLSHDIKFWYPLEAHKLVEDYKKGILKGQLKEIAATLDEDDNPVIMLIKHKK